MEETGLLQPELPLHVFSELLAQKELSARDLAACARVSTLWRAAAEQDAPWAAARRRNFPLAADATVSVLLERALSSQRQGLTSLLPSQQQQQQQQLLQYSAEKTVYRWLAAPATCDRCGEGFTDGTNTPTSCCYHSGILFSGGQLNGTGLRFTCCNRRAHHIPNGSRDSNGCCHSFHGGGSSAWQRHGTGVKPREPAPDSAPSGNGSSGSAIASSSSGSGPNRPPRCQPWISTSRLAAVEWHPNQQPGRLELPSRLLLGGRG